MKVAIDGPAGSGKSTVAKAIAKKCGFTLLDTGAMYRSVALACVQRGVDLNDTDAVAQVAREVKISFVPGEKVQRVLLDGEDVTSDIRTPLIDKAVTPVSANPGVREAMVAQQRAIGEQGDVVAEGRDIGTVVFPDAEVKVFLTADPAARALRRAVQRDGGDAATDAHATADQSAVEEIMADLIRRDKADSTREASPLRPAEDAVHIDSSNKTVDMVVSMIIQMMEGAR
ncbi:MAG: (d)CMP kinase [Coriobacteriales bacterium]|jgi:cytidylate kinase|nr:(d)CMP kinase [Coriobacteriales bacterium]